jgi:nicotinamidase-related amidase
MSQRALIVIDIQNDYFPGGKFALWNTESTLVNIEQAMTTQSCVNHTATQGGTDA